TYGSLALRTHLQLKGRALEAAGTPVLEHTPENQRLVIKHYAMWAHDRLEQERDRLQLLNSRHLPKIPLEHVRERVAYLASGIISLAELDKKHRFELGKLTKLETYLGKKAMSQLNTTPRKGKGGPRRRSFGWRQHKPKYNRRRDQ